MASGVWEAILAPEAAAQACGGDEEGVVDAYVKVVSTYLSTSYDLSHTWHAHVHTTRD